MGFNLFHYFCTNSYQMETINPIREVQVFRYLQPLKEGGSLPGLVEADDGFKYVIKFKGAGQGYKALVAELISGQIAKKLGLRIPEIVFAQLDESFGRIEPDQEIQDLLKASEGQNLGLHFLSGALTFDPVVHQVDELLASQIVWLDAYLFNVDRTARNTNMLFWNKELWLIDHGASLYFHHNWESWTSFIHKPFLQVRDHVLLPWAGKIGEADQVLKHLIDEEAIRQIVAQVPDEWMEQDGDDMNARNKKEIYTTLLTQRLSQSETFVNAIKDAR